MTTPMSSQGVDGVSLIEQDQSLEKAAETTQLDDRHVGHTIGGGIKPPYTPDRLAALQELNGTHAISIGKKASREVGFGFDIVPHARVDDPNESQREAARDFWHGPETIWKIGPQGTVSGSPTEVFELARRDYHGIGWACLELIYGNDDTLQGMAHVPAVETRVRKAETEDGLVQRGHGYVQDEDGATRYYGEAGDRVADDPQYIDKQNGEMAESIEELEHAPANELIFIPNPSPLSKYYGIPDWVAEVQTMMADQAAKEFNRDFFSNDAIPQYAIIVEGGTLSESAREDVRDLINNLRKKEGRSVPVLEAEELADHGIDVDSTISIRIEQLTQQGDEDMAFIDYRRQNEHEVAKVHELPPQLIGNMESANRANSREAIRSFTKTVIEPAQEKFADRLYRIVHRDILGITDYTLSFRTRGAENERQEAEVARTIMDAVGQSLTINEARNIANSISDVTIDNIDELDGVLYGDAFDAQVTTLPRDIGE